MDKITRGSLLGDVHSSGYRVVPDFQTEGHPYFKTKKTKNDLH
jgi:hypothetical protein